MGCGGGRGADGGPWGAGDAWRDGRRPVVVPRLASADVGWAVVPGDRRTRSEMALTVKKKGFFLLIIIILKILPKHRIRKEAMLFGGSERGRSGGRGGRGQE